MAYTTKDLEKQKKQQGISKDKLSYAVAQGGNAAALAGGMAKQGINAAKQVGYGIGTIKRCSTSRRTMRNPTKLSRHRRI